MATHFGKLRGIKHSLGSIGLDKVPPKYMKQMIVREHVDKSKNLHPKAKAKRNRLTTPLLPLEFKLHDMSVVRQK